MDTSSSDNMTGGLKVKKQVPKATIQSAINQYLYDNVPISAFVQESIQTKIKNTVNIKCGTCGSDNVYSESRQTRSGDEAMTIFYTCLNCGKKWKV